MSRIQREQLYRGKESMNKLASQSIHILGAGALGSQLAVNLVRAGIGKITVIDKDRVEEQNLSTQVWSLDDIGGLKADLLRNMISRDLGEEVLSRPVELTEQNINKLLKNTGLIVDVFDNTASRQLVFTFCKKHNLNCLHAGINSGYGEVRWNENYRVPEDAGMDICDYPLARNLILLVVAIASETIINFLLTGKKTNFSVTLEDLAINLEQD